MLEMSIVSCHQARLEALSEDGSRSADIVLKLRSNPNKMFSTVQFGITLISLLTGVYGGTAMAEPMSKYIAMVPAFEPYAYTISLTLIVVVITYLTIILGELVPKRIAIDSPEKVACLLARPMLFFSFIGTPLVWFLSASTAVVTKLIGASNPEVLPVTADEIKLLLEQGAEMGAFEKEEPELVERVFRLADMDVSDIMTNRPQIEWVDLEDPEKDIVKEMISFNHLNLPVGRGSLDDFLGIVSVNEVFQKYYDGIHNGRNVSITALMEESIHKPTYVPESMDIMKAVHIFREHSVHETAVLDEYGNFSGILTLHDILEELVGIMPAGEAEKVEEANKIIQRSANEWLIEGLLTIEEFKNFFHIEEEFPDEEEDLYKTMAGFFTYGIGRIPKETDTYIWENFTFEVMDMDNLRVDKLLVTQHEKPTSEEEE
jgi:putative hemolysin